MISINLKVNDGSNKCCEIVTEFSKNKKLIAENYQSVIPFLHRMLPTEQDQFMDEFVKLGLEIISAKNKLSKDPLIHCHNKIIAPYKVMTVFATKN